MTDTPLRDAERRFSASGAPDDRGRFLQECARAGVLGVGEGGAHVHAPTGIELVWVPPGTFLMGSDAGALEEFPLHEVRITRGFFLGKVEVTWAQYRAFCQATGRAEPGEGRFARRLRQPVVRVSWSDAQAFCQRGGLRLPTEAEWEYAARGTDGRTYPWGNQAPDAGRCSLALEGDGAAPPFSLTRAPAAEVGSSPAGASPFGALDMAGSTMEWVQDWYGDYLGRDGPQDDPAGPESGTCRVRRSGLRGTAVGEVRSTFSRGWSRPDFHDDFTGFRVVLPLPR